MKWVVTEINPITTRFGNYNERTLESTCGRFKKTTNKHCSSGIGTIVEDCYRDAPTRLADRLEKIGINCELLANVPWVYLNKVNGVEVQGKMNSDHYFCIGYVNRANLSQRRKVFAKIREIVENR